MRLSQSSGGPVVGVPHCLLRVQERGRLARLRVEGRATMAESPAVRRFGEQCLERGVAELRIDLSHCPYMDSTFLGTLLYLKRALDRAAQTEFLLVAPSSECCRLFQQMGLSPLFAVLNAEEANEESWVQLTGEEDDVGLFKHNVVQAHQELANLPGRAGEQFRAAAGSLAAELEAKPR